MRTISFEESSDRLAELLDSVAQEGEVVITRPGRGAVVLVSLSDYEALNETVHLKPLPMHQESNASRRWTTETVSMTSRWSTIR